MAEVDTVDVLDAAAATRTVATISKLIKTLGLPADAKNAATDTTSITAMQVLKQISASVQVPPLTPAGHSVAVTLTRTADTNAYLANDVLGAATGSTAALTFANMAGVSGGTIMITSAQLEIDVTAVPSGMTSFRLYLYNVTPPGALGDNAAFDLPSGDRASYLGYVDLGTPVDLGSTLYVEVNGINKQLKLAGTSLFAYLVTSGAYTPASATAHVVTLHAVDL